jgi:tetratricopeptide (TPR) repeat protein
MLDHYLRTAYAAARLLNPQPDIMAMAAPAIGTCPQPLTGYQGALDWFRTEHATLLALIGQAPDAGFPDHTWQLAWCMRHYLDRQGHWSDFAFSQHAALRAAQETRNLTGMAYAHRGIARADFNEDLPLPVDPGPGWPDGLSSTQGRLQPGEDGRTAPLRTGPSSRPLVDGRSRLSVKIANTGSELSVENDTRRDGALYHLEQALMLFEQQGDKLAMAYTYRQGVFVRRRLGDYESALAQAQIALALFRAADESAGEAAALVAVAWPLIDLGRSEEAIALCRQAIAIYDQIENKHDHAGAFDGLGYACHEVGRYDDAIDAYQRSIKHARRIGALRDIPAILLNLAKSYRAAGRHDEAGTAENEAQRILKDLGSASDIG